MTAKEAVNWIINIMADIGKSEHSDLWHYEQALTEIREMLEFEAQQWIPFSERLPKYPDRKQVQLSNGWIITAYFELGDWYSVPSMYDENDTYVSLKEAGYRVIAWRELPEQWKEKEE